MTIRRVSYENGFARVAKTTYTARIKSRKSKDKET